MSHLYYNTAIVLRGKRKINVPTNNNHDRNHQNTIFLCQKFADFGDLISRSRGSPKQGQSEKSLSASNRLKPI